jgi:hypothetical protein
MNKERHEAEAEAADADWPRMAIYEAVRERFKRS